MRISEKMQIVIDNYFKLECDVNTSIRNAYEKGFRTGVKKGLFVRPKLEQSMWIPCSEKLPEYGAGVLTINTDGDYEINHIIDEEDAEWFYNGVIAWMPLPEPYNEGE